MSAEVVSHGASGADPASVQTLSELATALQRLRGTRSYVELDKAVNANHRRKGPRTLAGSTLNNLLHGKSVPTRQTMVTFLTACGLDGPAQEPWLAAWERVRTAHLHRPAGAVRVRETRPRLLGVHASIQVDPAAADLPVYVPRDLDAELRAAIIVAAEHGGFVLLVGGSSVGKTRSLYEAVKAVVPEWWLIHPDPTDLDAVRALAAAGAPRVVVWLDELQRYLNNEASLPAATVRRLVTAGVILVATLWPNEYTSRTTAGRAPGEPDRHANDRDLLGLACIVGVPDAFSSPERRRAEALTSDQRIRIALDTPDAGFTQTLACGPELVRWWENAPDAYGKAIITAALDARRVDATAPLTREFLAAAAPGYLTSAQRATAPANWLDQALVYATTPLYGAASVLTPVAGGMGTTVGYLVADYLCQQALPIRRRVHVPETTWRSLVDHYHANDTDRLADNAKRRGRPDIAEVLYRSAAGRGSKPAALRLADLLGDEGRIDESITVLTSNVKAGAPYIGEKLARLLVEHDRVGDLRQLAGTGDLYAARELVYLLADRGCVDEAITVLRQLTDTGDRQALSKMAELLADQGRIDDAIAVLAELADAGDRFADFRLIDLLAEHRRVDKLRRYDGTYKEYAAYRLAEQGNVDEAITELRRLVDAGNRHAGRRLVELLAEQSRTEELRQYADAGNRNAAFRMAELLAQQGHVEKLCQYADAGDRHAANLLAAHGHIDKAITSLRKLADTGDKSAAVELAELLADHGRVDEVITIFRQYSDGFAYMDTCLARVLTEHGRVDEAVFILRPHADTGYLRAAEALVGLLANQGRLDDLEREVAAGTIGAAQRLATLNNSPRNLR